MFKRFREQRKTKSEGDFPLAEDSSGSSNNHRGSGGGGSGGGWRSNNKGGSAVNGSDTSRSRSAPRAGRRLLQFRKQQSQKAQARRSTIFFDASQGLQPAQLVEEDGDSLQFQGSNGVNGATTKKQPKKKLGSRFSKDESSYPIITTNYVARETRKFNLEEPESMLAMTLEDTEEPVKKNKKPSSRRFSFRQSRRPSSIKKDLEHPRVQVFEQGYPGQLSIVELQQCQTFLRALKTINEGDNDDNDNEENLMPDIVFSFKTIEDAPYAICRHMRSCKFDAQKQIDKYSDPAVRSIWKEGVAMDFCPNLQQALGGSVSPELMFSMFPMAFWGNAKNGCPVRYMKVGGFSPDGLLSLVPLQKGVNAWCWNQNAHVFPKSIQQAREANPDFVRCEAINVIDLNGLSRTQMSNDAIDILKQTVQVNQFFPETLHWTICLNSPGWFSFSWGLIKSMNFLNPRTANKVEVYSNQKKGIDRLLTMIDASEVPSDFGGKAPTLAEIVNASKEAGDAAITTTQPERYESKEVHVKKAKATVEELAQLQTGEAADNIAIYSRSIASAQVDVLLNGTKVKEGVSMSAPAANADAEEYAPYHVVMEGLKVSGPGTLSIQITEMDSTSVKDSSSSSNNSKAPRGCYVVAARISG